MSVIVSQINVFPIKSCRGLSVPSGIMTRSGFEFDRQWMIVSNEGKFLTQRELPLMSQIRPEIQSTSATSPTSPMPSAPSSALGSMPAQRDPDALHPRARHLDRQTGGRHRDHARVDRRRHRDAARARDHQRAIERGGDFLRAVAVVVR